MTEKDCDTCIPIIILNWNGLADTLECIDSVMEMKKVNFKIYLVDNASDNTEGIQLANRFADEDLVTVVLNQENLGFAKGNAAIVKQLLSDSSPKYIALLNNDTVVDQLWLHALVEAAEHHQAEVVSSKMLYYYDRRKLDNVGHQMLNTGEIVPIGFADPETDYDHSMENFGSCAGATLYASSMIRRIGFFDPHFSTGYEDAEFGARAVVTGHRCMYAPHARVYHKVSRSVNKVYNDEYELMIRDAIWYTYFKLMPRSLLVWQIPFLVFKFVVLLILNVITWRPRENRLMVRAASRALGKNWKVYWQAHHNFHSKHKVLTPWQIWKRLRFFVGFDVNRSWEIWITRKEGLI